MSTDLDDLFADLVARGRASEHDYDVATDSIADGSKSEADIFSEWKMLALSEGDAVMIKGLKGRADLNGLDGHVVSYSTDTKRFGVKLVANGETVAVKHLNLDGISGGAAEPASVLADKIGGDAAELVSSLLKCTRCQGPCAPGTKCRVPHPLHLRQDCGMCSGPHGIEASYICGACNSPFSIHTPWDRTGGQFKQGEPQLRGAEWCFAGVHTTKELPASDQRRVFPNTVALSAGPRLQEQIDDLPADVRTLTISSGGGLYDDELTATLERHLPQLEELQLVDVAFSKIVLNAALTPALARLRMQNVPDECDLTVECSRLRSVSIHYLSGCDVAINTMLEHATRLESFDSYKLWVGRLRFASNELEEVHPDARPAPCTMLTTTPSLACRWTCTGQTRSALSRSTRPT